MESNKRENSRNRVQVLLSTYNGEQYVKEQIDSILQQSVQVELLIRDDGSTDNTISILQEYEKNYSNIKVHYGTNVGVIDSFFTLVSLANKEDFSYFALADQDDVWLPNKLKRAIWLLEKKGGLVYCSDKKLVDENLSHLPTGVLYNKVKTEFGNALVENMCTGCTCVINKELLSLLQVGKPEFTVMHDFWIYLVGTCFGKVVYDKKSYILYRQHGKNELGAASSLIESYKRRIKNFRKYRGQLTKQAASFLRIYGEILPEDKKELLIDFLESKYNKDKRKKILRERKLFRQRKQDMFIMRQLLRLKLL